MAKIYFYYYLLKHGIFVQKKVFSEQWASTEGSEMAEKVPQLKTPALTCSKSWTCSTGWSKTRRIWMKASMRKRKKVFERRKLQKFSEKMKIRMRKLFWGQIRKFYYGRFFELQIREIILNVQGCPGSFPSSSILQPQQIPVPEFIDPVFTKTSPKLSFSLNRKRAFWLVFAKTGSIISGTG